MPRRPQRPCSYHDCPNLCDGQYCEEHAKQMNYRYNKFVQQTATINTAAGASGARCV